MMRRFGLRDDQWERIKHLLPGREGWVGMTWRTIGCLWRRCSIAIDARDAVARPAGAVRRRHKGPPAVQPLGEKRRVGPGISISRRRRRQRIRDDRQHHCARPSAQCRRSKKVGEDQAIGRSRGGLSTKIHALVDALGNPVGFFLTGGEAHDLEGADHLLPSMGPIR